MLKIIDYNDLNSLTVNQGQNEIGENLKSIKEELGSIKTIDDIKRLCLYIKDNFVHDPKRHKFEKSSELLVGQRLYAGCSDFGTIVAPILRMNDIPTVYVQSASIDWIKEYQAGHEDACLIGHIFLEISINDSWYLLDPIGCKLYFNYDINNEFLPKNLIAFSKSLNGHDVGCDNFVNNKKVMEEYFKDYDISKYVEPEYKVDKFGIKRTE